jgi:hypothetical protein
LETQYKKLKQQEDEEKIALEEELKNGGDGTRSRKKSINRSALPQVTQD